MTTSPEPPATPEPQKPPGTTDSEKNGRSQGRTGISGVEKAGIVLVLLCGLMGVLAYVSQREVTPGGRALVSNAFKKLSAGLERFKEDMGHYPAEDEGGLRALIMYVDFHDRPAGFDWRGPYIRIDDLKDPWGEEIHYSLLQPPEAERLRVPFKLWSAGPDMVEGNEDDIKNWSDD
jgi:hypothetical protein